MRILWISDSPDAPSGFGMVTRAVCEGLVARGPSRNVCADVEHELVPEAFGRARGERCTKCPWFATTSNDRGDEPIIRFDPDLLAIRRFAA